MSAAKRGGRFDYLTSAAEGSHTESQSDAGAGQEHDSDSSVGSDYARINPNSSESGVEGRRRTAAAGELASVPKGKGRMKQERSQLNVRLPTTLKRQASAKAVLEGRDIGEVVEELLLTYLDT